MQTLRNKKHRYEMRRIVRSNGISAYHFEIYGKAGRALGEASPLISLNLGDSSNRERDNQRGGTFRQSVQPKKV